MLVVSLASISFRLGLFVLAPSLVLIAFVVWAWRSSAIGYGLASFLASVAGEYILEAHGYVALFLSYAAVPLGAVLILAGFGGSLLPRIPARAG